MKEEGIVVLSLFDGISCGRVALERAGVPVKTYYASEIDKHAIKVSKDNWDDIVHIGDVTKVKLLDGILYTENGEYDVGKIDLILAGSPCQGFSTAGKQLAFSDPRSKLYFEFERILDEVKQENDGVLFLLENVKMSKTHEDVITQRLGVPPIAINSNLVSAQNRQRLYWTNQQGVIQPLDKGVSLEDVLEYGGWNIASIVGRRLNEQGSREDYNKKLPIVQCLEVRHHTTEKSNCLTTVQKDNVLTTQHKGRWPHAYSGEYNVRNLTTIECERLQTLPDNYTKCVSNNQRYKALGNGWTVDVIAHILKHMKF